MRYVYLVVITNDIQSITAYGTLARAKAALHKRMEMLLNDNDTISEKEKAGHRINFEKNLSYAIPYIPNYDTISTDNECGYMEDGEIIIEEVL